MAQPTVTPFAGLERIGHTGLEIVFTSPEVQQQMSPERMREQPRLSAYHLAEAVVAS
jgi:hypothetical protein